MEAMKKEYTEPVAELVIMKLEAPLCESYDYPDSVFDSFNDTVIDFIW